LVHVQSPSVYRLLLPALLFSRSSFAVHVHIEEDLETLQWAFRRPPELIITCARFLSDYVRRALPEHFRETQWIEAVPTGVDTATFSPGKKIEAKQRVGAPISTPLALVLANLSPHKGQETAIRAVAILKGLGISLTCWLAGSERGGSASYTTRLKTLIEELGVGDRIRLLGYRDDVAELLRAADFFLLPSTREGLPRSILEAQATKVPVLAAPTAGIPEVVIDGETGFLIEADDAPGYAHRIRSVLENPALCQRVVEQAYGQTRNEFSWQVHCERILSLYDSLTDRDGVRRSRRATPSRVTT